MISGRNCEFGMCVQENVGTATAGALRLIFPGTSGASQFIWLFNQSDRVTSGANTFVFLSDIQAYFAAASGSSNASVTNLQGVDWTENNPDAYVQVTAGGVSFAVPTLNMVSAAISSEVTARTNADNTLQANITTVESKLPLPEGMLCQVFSEAIPNPCPAEGWLVNIPTGWTTYSFVTACGIGTNVYAVSSKVENATQARLWAKYPTNGAWAAGGEVTVTSYGYYA
ncbi:hypothetical protein [Acetobacter pasteurianus]|uniref:hypothetical protein n=1 Tax=Acetobacter pasteurianus TaxID=438 RepID=UPI000F56B661|nr:hypothetical protein [Acetobacter pasteurianus]